MIRSDLKFYDNNYVWAEYNNLWHTSVANFGVAQGTSANQRVGNKIFIHKLLIRLMFAPFVLSTPDTCTWPTSLPSQNTTQIAATQRVVIVYDRQSNGALANSTDIFSTNGVESIQNFNNMDNKDRFTVLYDKKYMLSEGTLMGFSLNINLPIKRGTQYITNNTSGGISDMKTGAIYILTNTQFHNENLNTTLFAGTWRLNSRMRYSDI